jgi:energy-coupling factor transporter transmembrane protein EcfT
MIEEQIFEFMQEVIRIRRAEAARTMILGSLFHKEAREQIEVGYLLFRTP